MTSDLQLLQNYTRNKSEESFASLVNRHLNLVYSAALRQVGSQQLAEEVVQSAFIDLARQAQKLAPDTILSAWLYQVTRRTAINVVRGEARRKIRERISCELTIQNAPSHGESPFEALLDEAMDALNKTDRTAILLRFFENKSLSEVAQILGATDNATQKRIGRAVGRLREFFARRGVEVGASGLVAAISANAVQAAPLKLAATIPTASVISATTHLGAITISMTKAITMTTLQKTCIGTAFALVLGMGFFEAQKVSTLKTRIQVLQTQQEPLAERIRQMQDEREETARQLTALRSDNERLKGNTSELVRLRNEVGFLRNSQAAQEHATKQSQLPAITGPNSPSDDEIGRALGSAVIQGDPEAMEKLSALAKAEHERFSTNSVGSNDTQRDKLNRQIFAPLHAAFKVIEESAVAGNQVAADAVAKALQIPELKGAAVQCLGALASQGNDPALEILLNPLKNGLLLSGAVGALRPAADQGNQRAIDFLATIASDDTQPALWYMAATGLEKSAVAGNGIAIDALIGLSSNTNINLQSIVIPGLRAAAANQNAKAARALRSIGLE
jgi:RNA polymerase sigma factor (sigma-70 family)